MEITLEAQTRLETGKGPARRARMSGGVPAVLYGYGVDATPLVVNAKEMANAFNTEAGMNVLISLKLDGKQYLTVPREVHRHPVRGDYLHVDFVAVASDTKITAHIPVHVIGESRGIKEGGQLDQHLHELVVEALPADLLSAFEIDVTDLGIGDVVRVSDVVAPSGVDITTDAELVVLGIIQPHELKVEAEGEAEAEAEAAAAAAAAPAEPTPETSE
ncbi:MAG TPA: 50S ribosomal protein L25 [Actinomycetota bacterium]|nr:50S ribosomal protein L25 [Actinomycetota bacterium]